MPINIGNTSIDDIYIGSTPIDEIRIGSELIWSRNKQETYTLTINLGDGVDYSDIWYKEPSANEWVEASKCTTLTAMAGTEYYINAGAVNGYKVDYANLGSEYAPLILNSDITINISAQIDITESYELNIRATNGLRELKVQIGQDIVFNKYVYNDDLLGTDEPIIHDGSKPIYIYASALGSIESYDWDGNNKPIMAEGTEYDAYWDNLSESGTLIIRISSS